MDGRGGEGEEEVVGEEVEMERWRVWEGRDSGKLCTPPHMPGEATARDSATGIKASLSCKARLEKQCHRGLDSST